MASEDQIIEQLSGAGYRITAPRRAVVRALLEDEGHSTPAQVHARARRYCPTVGLVTIYRSLDLLIEMGFARRIHTEDGCHGYVPASHGHRHHIVCRNCGAAAEFEGCDLTPLLARVSREAGYEIETHLLELVGLCPDCQ
jgi:Fur family ferric uptake transcriptional regulator